MDYESCTKVRSDKHINVAENKVKFALKNINKKKINVTEVDGCLLGMEEEKCDYLFSIPEPDLKAFYVELKGCRLDKAISQLENTLLKTRQKFQKYKKLCVAVTTRVPSSGPSVQRLQLAFFRKNKVELFVKNLFVQINIE